MSIIRVLVFLPFLLVQGMAMDETQVRFYETMQLASTEGIPSVIRKLDSLVNSAPSSPFAPRIQETILAIGILYPGSIPDWNIRLASLTGNPLMAGVVKRIEILKNYYSVARQGHPERVLASLSDPVFEGSPYSIQAQADAALRARDYAKAAMLALQVIENDPSSPLLSNSYTVLGLSFAYQGDYKSALTHFQHALAASELPTIYGNPRDYVFTAFRFSGTAPAAESGFFDEILPAPLAMDLKEPQAMIYGDKNYLLLDKEMLVTVSGDGKVLDKKPVRKIVDIAAAELDPKQIYTITEEQLNLSSGIAANLSLNTGKKIKRISNLRSVAVGIGGDIYLLDDDSGLLHYSLENPTETKLDTGVSKSDKPAVAQTATLNVDTFAPVKGRVVRTDSRGDVYVLEKERKSILVFSRDGKQLASISADSVEGKTEPIDYFALDSLNHVYVLTSNSIQIFALKNGSAGSEKKRLGLVALDQRPQFKNLKVVGVNPSGELVTTGKNENNWVCFK